MERKSCLTNGILRHKFCEQRAYTPPPPISPTRSDVSRPSGTSLSFPPIPITAPVLPSVQCSAAMHTPATCPSCSIPRYLSTFKSTQPRVNPAKPVKRQGKECVLVGHKLISSFCLFCGHPPFLCGIRLLKLPPLYFLCYTSFLGPHLRLRHQCLSDSFQ